MPPGNQSFGILIVEELDRIVPKRIGIFKNERWQCRRQNTGYQRRIGGDFLFPRVEHAFNIGAAKAGLSALAAGLIHLGIRKENAITFGKFLVIAHGTPEEVAQARLIVGDAFVP